MGYYVLNNYYVPGAMINMVLAMMHAGGAPVCQM